MTTHTVHTRRIQPRDGERDRGSASVELAILAPLALVLLLSVLQAGLWWHTRTVCLHAAQQGVQAARTVTGTTTDAHTTATEFLARAPNSATAPSVSTEIGPETVTVRVSALAPRILPIPGLQIRLTQLAHAQRERFTTPGDDS